jgi:Carboxypeptidase regulatory-like domain/TonB dependent receptor
MKDETGFLTPVFAGGEERNNLLGRYRASRFQVQDFRTTIRVQYDEGWPMSQSRNGCARLRVFVFLLFTLAVFLPKTTWGQATGAELSGVVSDSSNAAVPGAAVSIKNIATGDVRDVTTNEDGLYSAPNLLPGTYDVTVSIKGFQSSAQRGITLTVGAQVALNFSLQVGQVNQTIEVNAAPVGVQTTSSTISATVDSTTVRELPLNGRDWTSLATLEPGVTKIPNQVGTAFNANKGNRGFGNQLSDSGHRPNENTYRVNGIVINDYSNAAPGGATGLNLGVDAIQEFSVLTTNYTGEYGRTSGAVINAITRSGSNQFHGTGYFFDRDKIFDAKNFFDPVGPIPSFRRIQFGGAGGGAIIKDKTFFFVDYEGVRQNQPISQAIHVPTPAERALAVPAVQPYLALWPLAPAGTPIDTNGTTQTFNVALPGIANENYFTARIDQKISAADNFAGSYLFDSGPQTQPDPLGNVIHEVFSRREMLSLEETHIFSPELVNTIRGGFSRARGDINLPVSAINPVGNDASLAIAPGAQATPQITVTGLTTAVGLGGLNQFLHRWNSFQFYDDAFLTRGTHSIKFGFAFERMQYNIIERVTPNGRMNAYTTLANFLNNVPTQLNALAPGGSHEVGIRQSLFAGYVQDDWRAKPNFTVNIGLRYEGTTLPTDVNNQIQLITTLTNCAASPTACTPVPVHSFISQNPTTLNFEPRIGFAWDPFKNGKTSVRAGFGIFDVLPLPYVFGLNTAASAPFQIIGSDPAAELGTPSQNVSFNPATIRNRYVFQKPKRGDVLNWNLNIQREIARSWTATVGFVGSRSVHLPVAADDINLVQPMAQTSAGLLWPLVGTGVQLDPNAGGGSGIRPELFDGAASYSSFQSQLKKTMAHGVQGQVSYTFGKCRDTSSAALTGDTYVNSVAVPILFDKHYRVGACDFDVRNALVGTLIWDLPGPKTSSAFLSNLAGGWELGSIVTRTSGSPFTATVGAGGDPLGTHFNGDFSMDFADLVPGCNPIHGGKDYLNVSCFALPTAPVSFASQCSAFPGAAQPAPGGTVYCANLLGNSGRNSFYGPGLTTVDFSIFKNTHVPKISETFNIQFRAEFFNILNHTNFAAPNFLNDANNSAFDPTGVSLANFGVLGSTATTSRQIQLGLKVMF